MTLLLKSARTPDTAVFSGDKRLNSSEGFEDTAIKATRLGRFAVGGACGSTRSLHPQTKIVQRDVHEDLRTFFLDRDVNDVSIQEFLGFLRMRYDAFVKDHRDGKPLEFEGKLFTIVMTSLQGDQLFDHAIHGHLSMKGGLDPKYDRHRCATGALMPYGDPPVTNAILSLSHPALAELAAQGDIFELLRRPADCPFGLVNLERLIEICRTVTRVSSEKAEQITGMPSTISPICDVLVLDPTGVREVK